MSFGRTYFRQVSASVLMLSSSPLCCLLKIADDPLRIPPKAGKLFLAHIAKARQYLPVNALLILENCQGMKRQAPCLKLQEGNCSVPCSSIIRQCIDEKRPGHAIDPTIHRVYSLRITLWVVPIKNPPMLGDGLCNEGAEILYESRADPFTSEVSDICDLQ